MMGARGCILSWCLRSWISLVGAWRQACIAELDLLRIRINVTIGTWKCKLLERAFFFFLFAL